MRIVDPPVPPLAGQGAAQFDEMRHDTARREGAVSEVELIRREVVARARQRAAVLPVPASGPAPAQPPGPRPSPPPQSPGTEPQPGGSLPSGSAGLQAPDGLPPSATVPQAPIQPGGPLPSGAAGLQGLPAGHPPPGPVPDPSAGLPAGSLPSGSAGLQGLPPGSGPVPRAEPSKEAVDAATAAIEGGRGR